MEIVDGYCDYSCKKELETLMVRMANLSSYQPILVDSITFCIVFNRKAICKLLFLSASTM